MTLLNRDTLVDRPELVERGNEDDEEEEQDTEEIQTEILGDGGGPEINNLVFEPGDYNVVAGANAAAVLASGEQEGQFYEQAFINSAIQLKNLREEGEDIRDVGRFGLEKGIAELGVSERDVGVLREQPAQDEEEDVEASNEDTETLDEDEVQIEDVKEEEIGEIEDELDDMAPEDGGEAA